MSILATNDNSGIKASLFLSSTTKSCSLPSACLLLAKASLISLYNKSLFTTTSISVSGIANPFWEVVWVEVNVFWYNK